MTSHEGTPATAATAAARDTSAALLNASRAASVCRQYRGQDVIVLDVSAITALFDYFIIATATNRRQLHALAEEAARVLKQHGASRMGREGYDGNTSWIVEDFGDVVLHVFLPEARRLYDLENLWGDAQLVDWEQHAPDVDELAQSLPPDAAPAGDASGD